MKKNDIYEEISNISPDLIAEADPLLPKVTRKTKIIRSFSIIAACFSLLIVSSCLWLFLPYSMEIPEEIDALKGSEYYDLYLNLLLNERNNNGEPKNNYEKHIEPKIFLEELKNVTFLYPYLGLDSERELARTLYPAMHGFDRSITKSELKKAVAAAYAAYNDYTAELRRQGEAALDYARGNGKRIMILAGRPYHIDPEIGHGIDKLAASLGFVVVSEDAVAHLAPVQHVKVLDQWTFHARLYRAAAYAAEHDDTELVQLVSFGCGVDAITTDEVRAILEAKGKYYTQIKIDEITNLGAVRIRLRSLLGALEERS